MLLLSALWWMRLSKRLVQASSWQGLVSGCWWLDLVLVPLAGVTMLRKTLSILSADGSGSDPSLFVVWCEASQHWRLQAVGWC